MWKGRSYSHWLLPQDGLCLSRQASTFKVSSYGHFIQPWLADSAATDHVTASLNQLSFPKPYPSQEQLTVGNGQNLPITHIGNLLIPSSNSAIQLKNVLRVPSIASNLASIHKICYDNNYSCYFDANTLLIQALATRTILYKGKSEGGVYPIYPHKATKLLLPQKVCNSVKLS